VLGSGQAHSVRELVDAAFAEVGLEADPHLRLDRGEMRWADRQFALADPGKAREKLGWEARTDFAGLVRTMVSADLRELGG
jgi:GDPmannose 4,6-dehydratase